MKEPIPEHVDLHGHYVNGGYIGGKHVVPLKDLVQCNSVYQTSEPATQ
jgi:hypothetical protein